MDSPSSKVTKAFYRRNLPHLQGFGRTVYVTFRSMLSHDFPEFVRDDIMEHCLFDHGCRALMRCAVVMPNHVHMIFRPKFDQEGVPYSLSEIMNGIKGASAHTINRRLERKGRVWQDESFDHVLRNAESPDEKVLYIANNPVRWGLARTTRDYPWYWAEPGPSNYVRRVDREGPVTHR